MPTPSRADTAPPPVSHTSRQPSQRRTVVVCLPAGPAPRDLPQLATAALQPHGLTSAAPVPRFPAKTRRARRLIDLRAGHTSGGPVRYLDLDRMRQAAHHAALAHWDLWRQVVAGTRAAQPYWWHLDRHRANPQRKSLRDCLAEYLAQPRIMAMKIHNATAHGGWILPTSAVEAFQAGPRAYAGLARLAAVPADLVLLTNTDEMLSCASERLADQLDYLRAANTRLDALAPTAQMVTMTAQPDGDA